MIWSCSPGRAAATRSPPRLGPVASGMGAVPAPGGLGDLADVGEAGRPAQLLGDPLGAGDERRRVAGAPADDLVADGPPHDGLARAEDLEHGDPGPRAEVVRAGHAGLEALDCELVGL